MSRPSSASDSPIPGYYKLPPIITTEADREFLNDVNSHVENELSKLSNVDEEQRYIIYKAVFNRVIEHVTAYKPVLTSIKKEYEDTIETIKKGQREAAFLQGKLKAMASEPSTLRNYKKRADELEERISVVRKDNGKLQKELSEIQVIRQERETRPKTAEKPQRELKKDSRLIPGLSLEETTDMKVLQKKYDALDRQLKELNLSLRARFLPKSNKVQLKDGLDNKVEYRDKLLWQTQVYKARGQKLKIALEAATAYNQMKPPHQTVGDAVMIAFQQASGFLRAEREKAEGAEPEAAQATTFEDDDPNKEKEAEMMLEYIEKFNELFEDAHYEEAAVHAANSPKGILRTQATLAKFRDVKTKIRGRSPLLAFCDAMMSSVKAAGSKPNEALSLDCMAAGLKENRLDLAYHWLAQDRLSLSAGLGALCTGHCSCPPPCKCGCQALAQNIFSRLGAHSDVVLCMLKQGKVQGALQHIRKTQCVTRANLRIVLSVCLSQALINGLMETSPKADTDGNSPQADTDVSPVSVGDMLMLLKEWDKPLVAVALVRAMLRADSTSPIPTLQKAVLHDKTTTATQWHDIVEFLGSNGHYDLALQLLSMATVKDIMMNAYSRAGEEKGRGVSFSHAVQMKSDDESSLGMSARSRHSASFERSSRESSPDMPVARRDIKSPKGSILKKKEKKSVSVRLDNDTSDDNSPRRDPAPRKKRGVRMGGVNFGDGMSEEAPGTPVETEGNGNQVDNPVEIEEPAPSRIRFNVESEVTSSPRLTPRDNPGSGVRFTENDPYTSNPEDESEAE